MLYLAANGPRLRDLHYLPMFLDELNTSIYGRACFLNTAEQGKRFKDNGLSGIDRSTLNPDHPSGVLS